MVRRAIWLAVGAASGFVAAVWTLAGVRRVRTQLDPSTATTRVGRQVTGVTHRVRDAVAEGREAARAYEVEAARRHRLV
jgi:hypothetical protein